MAKKKTENVNETEETQSIEQEQPVDASEPTETVNENPFLPADYAPTWTDDPEAPRHGVSFTLPRGVLVALLDPAHTIADIDGARHLGLIDESGNLTPIGEIARKSFDETAVRHKMLAAWRAQHNAGVSGR